MTDPTSHGGSPSTHVAHRPLGLTPVPQAGEPVPDSLVTVGPALSQPNHPAALDQVPHLVLDHGDRARRVWARRARQQDAGGMAAWLEQDGYGRHGWSGCWDRPERPNGRRGPSPRGPHSPWKAMMLAEMLASSSRTPGRVGWNMYRLCWVSPGS